MSDFVLVPEPIDSAPASVLVAAVQAEYVSRYGGPDETPYEPTEFAPPHGDFLVGRLSGVPVAIGGWRRRDDTTAEIKRMYVAPQVRRQGLARRVLAALESSAAAAGCTHVVLETGSEQPEAIALYERSGYAPVEPYGTYAGEPSARHLGKPLTGPTSSATRAATT